VRFYEGRRLRQKWWILRVFVLIVVVVDVIIVVISVAAIVVIRQIIGGCGRDDDSGSQKQWVQWRQSFETGLVVSDDSLAEDIQCGKAIDKGEKGGEGGNN
jgi:hypothetical protein